MRNVNFWEDAVRTQVAWSRRDPRFRSLIAETQFPGLYAVVHGECVLKVGEAGTVRNGKQGTVGKRLKKHLNDGYAPAGSYYSGDFPAWWEFTGALIERELTIYTLSFDGDSNARRGVEDAAIQAVASGVLWETMQGDESRTDPATKKPQLKLRTPGAVRRRVLAELGNQA
jgi:hypothetical protein